MPASICSCSPTCKSRDTELGPKLHAIIADAVRDGRISRSRIEKAYGKIAALKRR